MTLAFKMDPRLRGDDGGVDRKARSEGGFSLLELVIVILLITLLTLVALERLLPLRARVEQTEFQVNLGSMRRALGYELARRVLDAQAESIAKLAGSNPVDLLATPPRNYRGEQTAAEPGQWYFDRAAGELVYRLEHTQHWMPTQTGPAQIRLRVVVRYLDDGDSEPAEDRLAAVEIVSSPPWRWNEMGSKSLGLEGWQEGVRTQ
jgi:type II secretory pathway pseudopilin PulG